MVKDPVCGMEIDENKTRFKSEHSGATYFLCSEGCKSSFDNNPQKYVS